MPILPQDFENLAQALQDKHFDLMIVADGSGNSKDAPCGWASFVYDRKEAKIIRHTGGTSGGTNNYAELSPFLHALWHYNSGREDPANGITILCVSDSELTVKQGNGVYSINSNAALWAGIEWYKKSGCYIIKWRWVPRNSNPINELCDAESKKNRLMFANGDAHDKSEKII